MNTVHAGDRLTFLESVPRTRLYLSLREVAGALGRLALSGPLKGVPVAEFEDAFASGHRVVGAVAAPYARVCLYYLLRALKLPPGSEIVTTPITIHDMVNVILLAGHRPRFVDINPRTYQTDVDLLAKAITPLTSVVLVTHLFGILGDMRAIAGFCSRNGLILLEDASHSVGAAYDGVPAGMFGRAGFFSLSSLKSVSSGFGGIAVSENTAILDALRRDLQDLRPCMRKDLWGILFKNLIISLVTHPALFTVAAFPVIRHLNTLSPNIVQRMQTDNPERLLLKEIPREWLWGFSPMQADLALASLRRLNKVVQLRRRNAGILLDLLDGVVPERLPEIYPKAFNVYWRFPLHVPEGIEFQRFMNRRGIDVTTTLLPCCTSEPVFQQLSQPAPHAMEVVNQIYFLPVEPGISPRQMQMMGNAVREFFVAGGR